MEENRITDEATLQARIENFTAAIDLKSLAIYVRMKENESDGLCAVRQCPSRYILDLLGLSPLTDAAEVLAILEHYYYQKKELEYWKRRCQAAEKCIENSPCDPDITPSQIEAFKEWGAILLEEVKGD